MYNILFNGQQTLLVLLSAFVIGGVFKRYGLFIPVFTMLSNKVKSKRIGLLCISIVSGMLPVEGRVSVSAPILDSLVRAPKDSCCAGEARGKMGVVDYIATHHYYLWSPLEKSVILLMAGLGLTYAQLLSYTALPLLAYLLFMLFIVFNYVKEEDIELVKNQRKYTVLEVLQIVPFFAGLIISIFISPWMVFPFVAMYYVATNRVSAREVFSFIKWDTLILVAAIIVLANSIKLYSDDIMSFLKLHTPNGTPSLTTVTVAVLGGGLASLLLGSSSKYAGICVSLTLLLGIEYFPIIFMTEYAAYLLSPVHKCAAISASYFNTRAKDFYKYVGCLSLLMVASGLLLVVILK